MAGRRSEPAALEGVLGFLRLLWALDRGLQLVSRRMAAARGVTGQQRLALRIIAQHPRLAPGQLADLLHLDPSTVTGIVKRLGKQGFVAKRLDPDDRRRVILTLTDKGRRVTASRSGTVEALVSRALARLPRAKVAATEEVLRTLAKVLAREVG